PRRLSSRACASPFVIGRACPRMEVKAAMEGGTPPPGSWPNLGARRAMTAAGAPARPPAKARKARRLIMRGFYRRFWHHARSEGDEGVSDPGKAKPACRR